MDIAERDQSRRQEIKEKYNSSQTNNSSFFPKNNYVVSLGLIAGVLMSLYLLALNLMTNSDFGFSKYFQYLILAGFLYMALAKNEKAKAEGGVFQNGLRVGALVSIFSSLALVLTDLLFSFISPELAFRQFNSEVVGITQHLASSFGLALEVFVFGMIITFIFLQFQKNRSSS